MIKETKSKIYKLLKYAFLIGFLAVFVVVPFTRTAVAQSVESPPINNALDVVSVVPAQPALNQTAQITVRMKSNYQTSVGETASFSISADRLAAGASDCGIFRRNCTSVGTGSGNGRQGSISIPLRATSGFTAGNTQLLVSMTYTRIESEGSFSQSYNQLITLSISPASTSGAASIQISQQKEYFPDTKIAREYSVSYSAGSETRPLLSFRFDCGNGVSGSVTDVQNPKFECQYAQAVGKYTLNASALTTGGQVLATSQLQVDIKGDEIKNSLPNTAQADAGIWGLVNKVIGALLQLVLEIVYFIFYWVIAPVIQAMLSIRTYTDTFVNVIYPGWEVVRNVCNLFFIVSLIAIALGTLFRVESYKYKHLLVQLILAALLVNFSLVIAQAILGLADTIQNQFLPNNVEVIRSLARDLMVTNIRSAVWDASVSQVGGFSNTVTLFFYASMSIGSFLVFAAIAVFLVVRTIMIWIYLLTSPVAYAAGVLPSTAKYRGEWWSGFIKYAMFTPIMAFFLNLAAVIAAQTREQSLLQSVTSADLGNSEFAVFVFKVASNILLLVFLYAALKVAEEFGVMGASAVTEIAKKGFMAPFAVPAGAAKFGGEKLWGIAQRKKTEMSLPLGDSDSRIKKMAFVALNPTKFISQWKARTEARQKVIDHAAEGTAGNIVTDLPWNKEPSVDGRAENYLHDVAEAEKELPSLGEQNNFAQLKDFMASGKKDINGRRMVWAKIMQMARNDKSTNFILSKAKELGMDKNYTANGEGLVAFMQNMKEKGWGTEAEIAHIVSTLSNVYYKNGEYNFVEMSKANHHGHPELIKYDKTENGGKGGILGKTLYETHSEDIEDTIYRRALDIRADALARGEVIEPEVALQQAQGEKKQIMENLYNSDPALQTQYHSFHEFEETYENYETYLSRKEEGQINKNKSENQAFARDVHWSDAADLEPTGRYELGYGSAADIYDRTSGFYGQVNRMQPKKVEAWVKAYSNAKSVTLPANSPGNKYEDPANKAEIMVADRAYSKIIDRAKAKGVVVDNTFKKDARKVSLAAAKQRINAFERFVVNGEKYSNGDESKGISAPAFNNLETAFNAFTLAHAGVLDPEVRKAFSISS